MHTVKTGLKRVCLHWTAGSLSVNSVDKRHYHYIVDGQGVVHNGIHKPQSNAKQLSNRDKYAAHCAGGNSYTLGVAVCGGFKGYRLGAYTQKSLERACELIAKVCKNEGIEVTPDTVYTHYEFGKKHPNTDSGGKIDINQIPWDTAISPNEVGNEIRRKIRWYMARL